VIQKCQVHKMRLESALTVTRRVMASVRLASPVQAADKPAASAGLDRTVHPVFALANQHILWEFNDLARRLDN
jgi:hypothetical protein